MVPLSSSQSPVFADQPELFRCQGHQPATGQGSFSRGSRQCFDTLNHYRFTDMGFGLFLDLPKSGQADLAALATRAASRAA